MKILQVISKGYLAGGAEASASFIKEELQKRGHDVRVLSADAQGKGKFSDVEFPMISASASFKSLRHLFYLRSYSALRQLITDFRPDVVHFHTVTDLTPSAFFALRGTPAVMTIHGPEEFTLSMLPWYLTPQDYRTTPFDLTDLTLFGRLRYWYYSRVQRQVYRLGFKHIQIFIAPSKYLAKEIALDVPQQKIRQIYNGIVLPAARPLPEGTNVLYVGRLEKIKGVDHLIRAFGQVITTIPDARLTIVGDGTGRKEFSQLVSELGLSDSVHFAGWVTESEKLLAEYERSVAVVIPSAWPENLPTVCIEAFAVGRPVIGTNTGGIPELITDGETGYIVPMRDADALAKALTTLLRSRPTLEAMSIAARASSDRFRIDRFVDRIEEVYREVTEAKGGQSE